MKMLSPLVVAVSLLWAAGAQAMPLAPLSQPQSGLTVKVGGGCGLGVRRGLGGECVPVYVYGDYDPYYRGYIRGYYRGYRRGYYEGRRNAYYPYVRYPNDTGVVVVDKGVCGFGSYLSCSYGTCWRYCN